MMFQIIVRFPNQSKGRTVRRLDSLEDARDYIDDEFDASNLPDDTVVRIVRYRGSKDWFGNLVEEYRIQNGEVIPYTEPFWATPRYLEERGYKVTPEVEEARERAKAQKRAYERSGYYHRKLEDLTGDSFLTSGFESGIGEDKEAHKRAIKKLKSGERLPFRSWYFPEGVEFNLEEARKFGSLEIEPDAREEVLESLSSEEIEAIDSLDPFVLTRYLDKGSRDKKLREFRDSLEEGDEE